VTPFAHRKGVIQSPKGGHCVPYKKNHMNQCAIATPRAAATPIPTRKKMLVWKVPSYLQGSLPERGA